ncbi:hypothetical protein D3C73_757010 [compost metagenome]
MFSIDEGADAALLLGFCNRLQRECRLTRTFRTVNFDDTALGETANAERNIEAERAGRNRLDLDDTVVRTELHDRAFAEGSFNLRECCFERLTLVHAFFLYEPQCVLCHEIPPLGYCRRASNEAADGIFVLILFSFCKPRPSACNENIISPLFH